MKIIQNKSITFLSLFACGGIEFVFKNVNARFSFLLPTLWGHKSLFCLKLSCNRKQKA